MNWLKRLFGSGGSSEEKSSERSAAKFAVVVTDEFRARYASLAMPAVQLRPKDEAAFSQLGGLPKMPADIAWPEWKGKPQSFLAQIDLAEIHRALPSCLPSRGCLYFFYDQEQSIWGFDPKDLGGWRVIYFPGEGASLPERPAPPGTDENFVFACKPVEPVRIDVLPDSQRLPRDSFDWDRDGEVYTKLREEAFEGITRHQMFGFPTPVQGDDMELECQLASNGIYVGTPEGYGDPRRATLESGVNDWKLLLQLDSDDEVGWMWGDVGTIYFWIREQDARAGDFTKVWFSYQCC